MLTRKTTSQTREEDWLSFSSGLVNILCSDYIAMRLLYGIEPVTTSMTIATKMVEIVEKSLKLHLVVRRRSNTALTDARRRYGHNIEALRAACAEYDQAFDHDDIRDLTKFLNDKDGKLYQYLRYGSQETTEGMAFHLRSMLPTVDRIFAQSLLLLPTNQRNLLLFCSTLKQLVTRSKFDQSQHPDQVLHLLSRDNIFFDNFVLLFKSMDEENERFPRNFDSEYQ